MIFITFFIFRKITFNKIVLLRNQVAISKKNVALIRNGHLDSNLCANL